MIRVVKVNGLNTPKQRATCVYVGRAFAGWPASPWGNPFKRGGTIAEILQRYREYAEAKPPEWLAELWERTDHGRIPLGCWCCDWDGTGEPPMVCHGVILSILLHERFTLSTGTGDDHG